MKKFFYFVTLVCLLFMALLTGCRTTSNDNYSSEESMKKYYTKDDFECITIGESTSRDVYDIAPSKVMQMTSYGGFCEYPMQNGGYVRIKFYGKELIVGAIEEDSPAT